ncbi:MAG: hypothetical protein RL220_1407 [Bacteroidota bacterium]
MEQIRKGFAYILYGIIGFITLIAILNIWGIVDWEMVSEFFWKSVSSLIALIIGGVAVYIVYSIFSGGSSEARR